MHFKNIYHFILAYLFVCVCVCHMNLYTLRHYNRMLDLLELKLKVVLISLHVVFSETWSSWGTTGAMPWPFQGLHIATMDTLTVSLELFLVVQQPEVQWDGLQAKVGHQPSLMAICRLKSLPWGSYSTGDYQHLAEEEHGHIASTKERWGRELSTTLLPALC